MASRDAQAETRAASVLRDARHAVALTGAGMSTESGIPDFRSPGGLWSRFEPTEYATLSCFRHDPDKAWTLYRALGAVVIDKQPHDGHLALARLEAAGRLAGIVTQNVDGLHQAAGSTRVLEIHGDSGRLQCLRCGTLTPMTREHLREGPVPRCERCAVPLKPNVVLFEEDVRHLGEIRAILAPCDVLLVVGTSAEVVPASSIPDLVRSNGGTIVEFNLERCLPAHVHVPGLVGQTLPSVAAAVVGSGDLPSP